MGFSAVRKKSRRASGGPGYGKKTRYQVMVTVRVSR